MWGLWFGVRDLGFRVQGAGFRVQGSGFRVQGSGFRVQGSKFRVQCAGLIHLEEVKLLALLRILLLDQFVKQLPHVRPLALRDEWLLRKRKF